MYRVLNFMVSVTMKQCWTRKIHNQIPYSYSTMWRARNRTRYETTFAWADIMRSIRSIYAKHTPKYPSGWFEITQTWFSYRKYCKYFTGLFTLFTRSAHAFHRVCLRCSPGLSTLSLEAMAPHPVVLWSIDDKIVKGSSSAKYRDIIKHLVKPTTRIRSTPSISPRRGSSN